MKAPIKERIVAIRYKAISDEVYHEVCDALVVFLTEAFPNDGFTAEKLNIPKVTLPVATLGDEEPDWSKVRVSVDRPSRFWNAGRTRCIQFFKDCFTINLISLDGQKEWSHSDLFAFTEDLLPFITMHDKKFEDAICSVDYLNALDRSQLEPYIVNDGKTLELARVLKGSILGQTIAGAMPTTPFSYRLSYAPAQNIEEAKPFPALLNIDISVPQLGANSWCIKVGLSAVGTYFPGFSKDAFLKYLDRMHAAVTQGFCVTFSEGVLGSMEGVR